ncbi:unnamed protein product [Plasmodium vivax]|uniref:(malaria parasite P. vivax) hypothetical protein n=1 Tax=Plasmodium vivax TaxID=5855 RepID=A0A8S4HBP2_PLAVI|nr:unnamed protein product [Plasmodium vivax]
MFVFIICYFKEYYVLLLLNYMQYLRYNSFYFTNIKIYIFYLYFQYPILENVWNTYDKFDETVNNDSKNYYYYFVCNYIIDPQKGDTTEHEEFCKKLVRNLGHYSGNNEFLRYKPERCKDLNNWIYNSMMKQNIRENIIKECFKEYDDTVRGMHQTPPCFYYEYVQNYAEPMKIIMLNIFESSMGTIENILNGEKGKINNLLRKYVCENVQIYKDMYKKYCVKTEGNQKHINTCSKLDQFKISYMYYFRNKMVNETEIPSLDDIQNNHLTECQKYLQEQALNPTVVSQEQHIPSSRTPPQDSISDTPASITLHEGENQSSPMSSTVSTALGTVAGASSILALLYKFTPGRRWMHSGIGRNRGRISNHLYGEEPNELLFDGFQGEDMSSYNARYNIGYSSV